MNKRIESIDGWRAIAALGVLYTHVWATLSFPTHTVAGVDLMRLLNLWGNGVQLFFVISGFCFYLVLEKQQQYNFATAFAFWKKRWLRIAPAFYTVCILLAVLHQSGADGNLLYKLFFNFIFLHNHVPGAEVDAIFWSLAVEWHFYLLLPLIFIAINRLGIIQTLAGLLVLCFGLSVLHYYGWLYPGDQWWYSIFNNIGHFAWGILVGYLFKKNIRIGFLTKACSLLIGLLIAYAGKTMFSSGMVERFPSFSVLLQSAGPLVMTFGFACMIYTALFNQFSFALIGNKVFSWIGKVSYSFYLWHSAVLAFIYSYAADYLPRTAFSVLLLLLITLTVLLPLSYLSYTLLESFYFKRKKD